MVAADPITALPGWAGELFSAAATAGADARAGIEVAVRFGTRLPAPGEGATAERWAVLAALGAADLSAARIMEAHADALSILHEYGAPEPSGAWGVFASEGPPPGLTAELSDDGWTLTGTKQWCSLAGLLDHALVTARAGTDRRLFAVDLRQDSVRAEPAERWVAHGLRQITSAPVHFDATPARAIGEPGWYLERPGFAWGGLGVAACWYGGARALYEALLAAVRTRPAQDIAALHLGTVDVALHGAESALREAARLVDSGAATGRAGEVLALRVRSVVASAAETVLHHVGHALGPAPLAFDELHAQRVADLTLYVRQHHGERDLAALGRLLREDGRP